MHYIRLLALAAALLTPAAWAAPFADHGDGTVTDQATGLMWDKCALGLTGETCVTGTAPRLTWANALLAAQQANTDRHLSYTDWRLPNLKELESLVEIAKASSPVIDGSSFPNTPSNIFWSSTTYAFNPASVWVVNFSNGTIGANDKGGNDGTYFVRLVRSGQSLAAFDLLAPRSDPKLNDSGQVNCYDANVQTGTVSTATPNPTSSGFARQDCTQGRAAADALGRLAKTGASTVKGRDYTKIANNGSALDASATLGTGDTNWACTKDNVTGLIWEVKTTGSGLRSVNNKYSWYDTSLSVNDGNAGTQNGGSCSGSSCDTTGFRDAVNAAGLCGASDWRLPTQKELQSLVDYNNTGLSTATIDNVWFPITQRSKYWTGVTYAAGVDSAWGVTYVDGTLNAYGKNSTGYVRLVRGGQ